MSRSRGLSTPPVYGTPGWVNPFHGGGRDKYFQRLNDSGANTAGEAVLISTLTSVRRIGRSVMRGPFTFENRAARSMLPGAASQPEAFLGHCCRATFTGAAQFRSASPSIVRRNRRAGILVAERE
jgi:hypothetical protein